MCVLGSALLGPAATPAAPESWYDEAITVRAPGGRGAGRGRRGRPGVGGGGGGGMLAVRSLGPHASAKGSSIRDSSPEAVSIRTYYILLRLGFDQECMPSRHGVDQG